jgi:hypothetical protein
MVGACVISNGKFQLSGISGKALGSTSSPRCPTTRVGRFNGTLRIGGLADWRRGGLSKYGTFSNFTL